MKNQETRTVFKVIFVWQDEKEEAWLHEMAAQGWHLLSVAPFVYIFSAGSPENVVYRLDYKLTIDKDYAEYEQIFCDSGWELVCRMSNWHYYRIKPENDQMPEIYDSNRAKAQKYRRLMLGLIVFLPILVILGNPALSRSVSNAEGSLAVIYGVALVIRLLLMLLFIVVILKLLGKIKKLESGLKE
jgi:hypothetical protein